MLKPLHDKVVIQPIEEEKKTKSGIVLPDTHEKEKPEKGKVVAVGPGKTSTDGKNIPMSVKKGDEVLFKKYSADEFKIGNKEYLTISEEDVIAIIK